VNGTSAVYFVVAIDDGFTTVVSSKDAVVRDYPNNTIASRTPCVNQKARVQRSLVQWNAGAEQEYCGSSDSRRPRDQSLVWAWLFGVWIMIGGIAGALVCRRSIGSRRGALSRALAS
jgi:hypothetical protein